ncbi:MAG TPA: ABC transporter substrate-binding protein [Mycobacteriales bacterium]|nr:ABC transporter substrate-binding protein [Mycobacteriales bacterium]
MNSLSRRSALTLLGGIGVGAGLAGCSVSTHEQKSGGSNEKSLPPIRIPQSDARLPSGHVRFQWMDSGGLKALFEQPMLDAYHRLHSNIDLTYDATSWDRINEAIPLGVRNGTAPDVFQLPQDVPAQTAVNEGWVAPLDDIIPDFQKWKGAFPESAFIPGVHIFDGRTYAFTFTSSKSQFPYLLAYDRKYLKQAGYDPSGERFTRSELRAACKKITQQGGGKYYGLMAAGTNLGGLCLGLAGLAGMRGSGGMDWKTGEYNYTAPELQAAFELLLAIKSDGSFFPDYLSLGDADARARMTQRVAGIIFDGPWDIPQWPKDDPGYDFGIASPPTGDDRKWHPYSFQEGTAAPLWVFAKSKAKAVAGDLFGYMGSVAGQRNTVLYTQGNFISEIPAANEEAKQTSLLNGRARTAADIMQGLMRAAPMVPTRNPDAAQVVLEQKPVVPALADVAQGIFSGQITDLAKALKSLNDRSEKSLDDAIAAAKKHGAKVSRDDWKFPNWNPAKDYTAADYRRLGG